MPSNILVAATSHVFLDAVAPSNDDSLRVEAVLLVESKDLTDLTVRAGLAGGDTFLASAS